MPTYEYRCDACGHEHEAEHSIKEEPLKQCPACQREALRRLISSGAFSLQGKGWFKTGGY
jgi:putative FmdB family regulatory protein